MRSSHDRGRSILRIGRDDDVNKGRLALDKGRFSAGLDLDPMLLPVDKPEIILDGADFVHASTADTRITGDLKWTLKEDSNWRNAINDAVDVALSRYTAFDMVWDGATNNTGGVTMETLSTKPVLMPGQVPPLALLDDSLSIRSMCLTNASTVKLVGEHNNQSANKATEVLFVRFLGISGNSMLKTNGFTLYYFAADPLCGLDLTRIDRTGGGDVIRIPGPGGLLLMAGVFAGARRRRRA